MDCRRNRLQTILLLWHCTCRIIHDNCDVCGSQQIFACNSTNFIPKSLLEEIYHNNRHICVDYTSSCSNKSVFNFNEADSEYFLFNQFNVSNIFSHKGEIYHTDSDIQCLYSCPQFSHCVLLCQNLANYSSTHYRHHCIVTKTDSLSMEVFRRVK